MITRRRVRAVVGLVVALGLIGPLGWMWWASLVPSTYSATDMGYVDLGTGRATKGQASHHAHHEDAVSVRDLDTDRTGPADVVVDLVAAEGTVRLASGRRVEGYTLNGSSPGPAIEARVGELVEVRLHNQDVRGGVSLHWHGVDVPNAQDGVAGVTQDAVQPGEEHTYRWVAPKAGTFWYHSHQLSHEQVRGGLLGALVIREAAGTTAPELVALSHLFGTTPTLNGDPGPLRLAAASGQTTRVRLVNTDNGPTTAWSRSPVRVLAVDGYDVHEPGVVRDRRIGIPAGGRVDLEVTAPDDGSAARVDLLGGMSVLVGPSAGTAPRAPRPSRTLDLLSYGTRGGETLAQGDVDRSFRYAIGKRPGFLDGRPGLWWSVNGHLWPDMPMMMVREGKVVEMTISNSSGEVHPMHLHGHHAVVLSRNGTAASGSPWWFDSLDVKDGETYRVAFVADNPGIWMDHCHNLEHATEGLVTHLMYEGVTTPFRLGSDSGNEPE